MKMTLYKPVMMIIGTRPILLRATAGAEAKRSFLL
jgi:hypothetical protein